MKITKARLKEIVKEEISLIGEDDVTNEGRDEIEGSDPAEMERHIQSLTKRVFELEKALKSMRGDI